MLGKPELVHRGEYPAFIYRQAPRNVYWETTISCDLACQHCRADAIPHRDPDELTTEQGKALMRDVRRMGSMMVLTGGDPLKRPDLLELVAYGRQIGLPMAVTPSTTPLLKRETVESFHQMGVMALGVSLDGPDAKVHDAFRGVEGTFAHSQNALAWAREFHMPVQVNTTVTARTLPHLPAMLDLLRRKHAPPVKRWSLFLLVPVGRGEDLGIPSAQQVEDLFGWVYESASRAPFHISTVEAPHYRRYWLQRKLAEGMSPDALLEPAKRMGFGVRDGNGVIFVSHKGEVFPAGFLPEPLLGNVKDRLLSDIYSRSPQLQKLRDMDQIKGKCGACEYRWLCGGSRARARGLEGDPMGSDPFCVYEPPAAASAPAL
ncbi:MAG: TIGR04053 family radical SAM/SPASM domain-containing protein [Acidobacteriota bacterium]